jgi:hypothetical protein
LTQLAEKVVANAGFPIGITDKKRAELCFGGQDLRGILAILLQKVRRPEKNVVRQTEISGIIGLAAGERIIIFAEIGREILHAEVNLDAIMNPVDVLADVAKNQEVGVVANLDIKPFAQQIVKEIVGFRETGVEIAKIETDFHHFFISKSP